MHGTLLPGQAGSPMLARYLRRFLLIPACCFLLLIGCAQTSHLKTVDDTAPAASRSHGFRPGKPGIYRYDKNGNLTYDPHKKLDIIYNHLNLPEEIIGSDTLIRITYDAVGTKLSKAVKGQYTRDYVSGIEYRDGVVEAIYSTLSDLVSSSHLLGFAIDPITKLPVPVPNPIMWANGGSSFTQIQGTHLPMYRYRHKGGMRGHYNDTYLDEIARYFRLCGVKVTVID